MSTPIPLSHSRWAEFDQVKAPSAAQYNQHTKPLSPSEIHWYPAICYTHPSESCPHAPACYETQCPAQVNPLTHMPTPFCAQGIVPDHGKTKNIPAQNHPARLPFVEIPQQAHAASIGTHESAHSSFITSSTNCPNGNANPATQRAPQRLLEVVTHSNSESSFGNVYQSDVCPNTATQHECATPEMASDMCDNAEMDTRITGNFAPTQYCMSASQVEYDSVEYSTSDTFGEEAAAQNDARSFASASASDSVKPRSVYTSCPIYYMVYQPPPLVYYYIPSTAKDYRPLRKDGIFYDVSEEEHSTR